MSTPRLPLTAPSKLHCFRAMPAIFVLIWKHRFCRGAPTACAAPPMGFLAWRYALSVLAFGCGSQIARPVWPRDRSQ